MNKQEEIIKVLFSCFAVILVFSVIIWGGISEYRTEKKYGPKNYELVIEQKYDMIGSTFHLIGGRASETEFHLVYKYRCTNRPDDKNWYRDDQCVSYSTYTRYKVGDKFEQHNSYIFY